MKISLEWLGEFVEWIETDPETIGARITETTAEVDEVEVQGSHLRDCCVGKVTNLRKHPNADKLSLCDVITDRGSKPIVCGGTNLREGMKVAFAHAGASVADHDGNMFVLSKAKIRGEVSEGMICAASELGLEDRFPSKSEDGERPVIDLGDGDEGVGSPLKEHLGFTDVILHIDNHAITHRPDLFSHIGFARECVAMGIARWKKQPVFDPPQFGKADLPFAMKTEDAALMPRYCSCLLRIDSVGETPLWMRRRLEATGWRCISLPIDITNYVMMEVGVPLHSFDADDIKGDVRMRSARKGEKIVTLDASERELSEGALILSDDEGVFDLLGIMGGLRSSTKQGSRNLYIHSASLDPVSIRRAMIEMGHRTDAGTTYEKSVPPITTEQGFYRTVQLMLDLVPGAAVVSRMESVGENGTAKTIRCSLSDVRMRLGIDVDMKRCFDILSHLGFTVTEVDADAFDVEAPLWRLKDISGSHDIIEEIGRMYGYNAIEAILPSADIRPPSREHRPSMMRDALRDCGYVETLPLSLLGSHTIERAGFSVADCLRLINPIGEETAYMQPSVLPQLLEQAAKQLRDSASLLKVFTVADVFRADCSGRRECGMIVASSGAKGIKQEPFYVLKRDLAHMLDSVGSSPAFVSSKDTFTFAHPGRIADVCVGDVCVGHLFGLHPSVCEAFDLPAGSAAALLSLPALLSCAPTVKTAGVVPMFPAVRYDVTVPRTQKNNTAEALLSMRSQSALLESIEIVDVYSQEKTAAGPFQLTLRCTYRAADRTLTEAEAKAEHEKVLSALA